MKKETTDALKEIDNEPKTTRRDFLQMAAVAGVTTSVASALWNQSAKASTPKRGGHLILGSGYGETTDSLELTSVVNPHIQTFKSGMLRNKLLDSNINGELEPDLATEWGSSSDATRWTFTLRSGVEFHNGKTVTVEDVIGSMNVHRGEDTKSGAKGLTQSISAIRKDGSDKVVFELSSGNADFPYYLAQYFFDVCPVVDGVVDDKSGVGTGPFILENFEPGVRAIGKRNPNYFKNGFPYVDSAELLSMNDVAARTTALLTGQVHAIDSVDFKVANRIASNDGTRIESVPTGSTVTMPMMANVAPFNDANVRRAMKYALNRTEFRDKIFYGHASLANDHPVARSSKFYNTDLPQREYDPDKARYYLKQAGHDTLDIELHTSEAAFPGATDAAVLFAESARTAGINVSVQRQPADGYWNNVWTKVPFCYCWWNARPTPDLILSLAYTSDAAWGDTNWKNERFDSIVAAARQEVNDALRKEMYNEIQQILHDDGSTIVPLYQNFVHGISDKIGHGKISGETPLDSGKAPETWWFV